MNGEISGIAWVARYTILIEFGYFQLAALQQDWRAQISFQSDPERQTGQCHRPLLETHSKGRLVVHIPNVVQIKHRCCAIGDSVQAHLQLGPVMVGCAGAQCYVSVVCNNTNWREELTDKLSKAHLFVPNLDEKATIHKFSLSCGLIFSIAFLANFAFAYADKRLHGHS